MKKHLPFVLVPLLAAGAVAHAQSNVTLYGRFNTTVENQKYSGESSKTGLHSNSSFLGFRGTEDLGGGLKAGFVLEQQFSSTDGSSTGFQRESQVNLSGSFGTIKAGSYNSTAYTTTADYVSMFNHDTGSTADALYAYVVPNTSKLGYISPEFAGFTFEAGYSFKDNQGGNKAPFDASVSYKLGALDLAAAYAQFDKAKATTVRALYTTGPFAFGGYVQYDKNGLNAAATDTSVPGYTNWGDRWSVRLVGAYTMGASEFHANVGWADKYSKIDKSGATQYTLGYNYNLSKRTKVYGFYTRVDNQRNGAYAGAAAGKDFSSVGAGLRHLF